MTALPNHQPVPSQPPGDRSSRWTYVLLAVVVVALLACAGALVMAGRILAEAAMAQIEQEQCADQLRKIGNALAAYNDEYTVFPPAFLADGQGVPQHSWRVLILPYLGQDEEALYKEYRFDEPWNGPHNRQLADQMPLAYSCPCDPGIVKSQTSFLALVDPASGEFAVQPNRKNRPPSAAPLPARAGFMVVEVAESGVGWLEPRDIGFANSRATQAFAKRARYSYHGRTSHALLEDGATKALTPPQVRASFTPSKSAPK